MNEHNDILKALRQQMIAHEQPEGNPFHVPENYFTELNNHILATIQDDEAATPLILGTEGKKPTFMVPEDYFDTLEQNITRKASSSAPVRKLFVYRWPRIAAAAVSGLIILSTIYYWNQAGSRQIAVQSKTGGTPVIHNISVTELTDFVGEGATGNIIGTDKKNSVDINQLFQQVSSQDLESFLNETAATNTELF